MKDKENKKTSNFDDIKEALDTIYFGTLARVSANICKSLNALTLPLEKAANNISSPINQLLKKCVAKNKKKRLPRKLKKKYKKLGIYE